MKRETCERCDIQKNVLTNSGSIDNYTCECPSRGVDSERCGRCEHLENTINMTIKICCDYVNSGQMFCDESKMDEIRRNVFRKLADEDLIDS